MNREIKFRAWDEVSEKILNWNDFLDTNMKNTFIAPESTGLILMQYTGLDDKNGKEIYEGDIAKYENMIGKIMFFNGSFILSDFEETEEWELGVINEELEIIGKEEYTKASMGEIIEQYYTANEDCITNQRIEDIIDRIDYDIKKTKEIISNDQKNNYQITRLKAMNTKSLDIKKRLQELLESEE